jgi:hypothetical protein
VNGQQEADPSGQAQHQERAEGRPIEADDLEAPGRNQEDLGRQAARARMRGGAPGRAYEDRTRQDLYEVAKRMNISGRSKMGKWDLIKAIRKAG